MKCCSNVWDKQKYWFYWLSSCPLLRAMPLLALSWATALSTIVVDSRWRGPGSLPSDAPSPQRSPWGGRWGRATFLFCPPESWRIKYLHKSLPTGLGLTHWILSLYISSNVDRSKALILTKEQLNKSLVKTHVGKATFLTWISKLWEISAHIWYINLCQAYSLFVTFLFYNSEFYSLLLYWISDLMLASGIR